MYKLLLAWRYLRTRYIALASIISVTLGVATMVVVNSVMAGFTNEMHKRLHAILSDVVIECHDSRGMPDPEWHIDEIKRVVGDDVEHITQVVHVPAMAMIKTPNGRSMTRWINIVGIDDATYDQVSEFTPHLIHPQNRSSLSFDLRNGGYDPSRPELEKAGWPHRLARIAYERALTEQWQLDASVHPPADSGPLETAPPSEEPFDPTTAPLPTAPPELAHELDAATDTTDGSQVTTDTAAAGTENPFQLQGEDAYVGKFDPTKEQHTGIILGISICSQRQKMPDGEARDFFYCQPGDDIQVAFPTASVQPTIVYDNFTVVDLYESKMSEYDSTFAFAPLSKLQQMRGMVDEGTGLTHVTSIQMKLRDGADLNMVRDKLRERFPANMFPYSIQTWRDLQGPLLAAVRLETTILNLLLFLIIAVAGFGILATFFMIVVEKTRDIGILKALGAPSGGVMSIFLSYGFSLGMVGSGVGAFLGLMFVWYINDIARLLEIFTGEPVFDPTIYYFSQIPTVIQPVTIIWVAIGAIFIAVMASVLPAIRAARLHPVEALRYE